jgi:cell division protein ZapA
MVDVQINGRRHQLQCGDGEEVRLRRLAAYVDSRLGKLVQEHGQLPEGKALLMTSLLVADELNDAYDEIKRLRAQLGNQTRAAEEEAAAALDRVAGRLEQLAAALETT